VQPEIRETLTVSRPRVLVGFKDVRPPLRGNALLDEELVTSVLLNLLFGKASAAHARWYERGLIDDSFAASFNADTTYGFTLIGGETEEPERLRDEVLGAIRRARKGRFTKQEVERARRQALGHYLRAFDSSEGIAFLLLGCHLRDADLFSWPGLAKRLTARRLSERLESHLDESRCAVSFAYPREEEK
jgi:predicted Zn-dependent peptidase